MPQFAVYANPGCNRAITFDIATLTWRRLGPPIFVLAKRDQDKISRALDELVSRA